MNRKGLLDVQTEFFIRLLYGALILVILVGLTYGIIRIFSHGSERRIAERNFDLLNERIKYAQNAHEEQASIIIDMPDGYNIVSFDPNQVVRYGREVCIIGFKGTLPYGAQAANPQCELPKTPKRPDIPITEQSCMCAIIPHPNNRACRTEDACLCLYQTQDFAYDAIKCKRIDVASIGGTGDRSNGLFYDIGTPRNVLITLKDNTLSVVG